MTKEEEKAIENLTKLLKQRNEKQVKITTYNLFENIETVLNILKQNSAELAEKSAEIEKDKIIDLMAEHINYLSDELVQATGRNELEFCNGNKCCIDSDYSCEQCIKQYFKQKATNNG